MNTDNIPLKHLGQIQYLAGEDNLKLEEMLATYKIQKHLCKQHKHITHFTECLDEEVRKHCKTYKQFCETYICER